MGEYDITLANWKRTKTKEEEMKFLVDMAESAIKLGYGDHFEEVIPAHFYLRRAVHYINRTQHPATKVTKQIEALEQRFKSIKKGPEPSESDVRAILKDDIGHYYQNTGIAWPDDYNHALYYRNELHILIRHFMGSFDLSKEILEIKEIDIGGTKPMLLKLLERGGAYYPPFYLDDTEFWMYLNKDNLNTLDERMNKEFES